MSEKHMFVIMIKEIIGARASLESFCVIIIGGVMSLLLLFNEWLHYFEIMCVVITFATIYISVYVTKFRFAMQKASDLVNMRNINSGITNLKVAYEKKLNEAEATAEGLKLKNAKLIDDLKMAHSLLGSDK
jgi:hypothetical protein